MPPSDRTAKILDDFEGKWKSAPPEPLLTHSLPDPTDAEYRYLVIELLKLDIDYRLKAGETVPVVKRCIERDNLSLDAEAQVELIEAEYEARWEAGDHVAREKYFEMFPALADRLRERLPDRSWSGDAAGFDRRDYPFFDRLGKGGMGAVYATRDSALECDLAIKVIHPRHQGKPEFEERFLKEAQILGKLTHPNIVPIHSFGRLPNGRLHFTMKLVRGETLAARLSKFGDRSRERQPVLRIFEQVAEAMAFAHARGVIHRDLKPGNVMIGAHGEVQVMDWGLAGEVGRAAPGGGRPGKGVSSLTQTGGVFGTPQYMAPEQARGESLDARADVFALGAILCEILTGYSPYLRPEEDEAKRFEPANKRPEVGDISPGLERLREERRGIDPRLAKLVTDCLETERDRRLADASKVVDRVREYQEAVAREAKEAEIAKAKAEEERLRAEAEKKAREEADQRANADRRAQRRTRVLAGVIFVALVGAVAAASGLYLQSDENKALATKNQGLFESEKEQRERAEDNERTAQRRASLLAFERGLTFCDQGRPGDGIAWLARALELAPADASELRDPIRYNLAHWPRLSPRLKAVVAGPTSTYALALTPDGRRLFSGGRDGSLLVWDPDTGKQLRAIRLAPPNETLGVERMEVSRDGKILYCAASDGIVRRFGLDNGKLEKLTDWAPHKGRVLALAVSGDSKLVASGSNDGQLLLRDAESGKTLHTLQPHGRGSGRPRSEGVRDVAFSPKSDLLISGGYDGTARVLDVKSGKEKLRLEHNPNSLVWAVCFCQVEGRLLQMTGGDEGDVKVWNEKGGPLEIGLRRRGPINRLLPRPDSDEVLVTSIDQTAVVWRGGSQSLDDEMRHPAPINNAAWGFDGNDLAVASSDVRVWDLKRKVTRVPIQMVGLKPDERFAPGGGAISPDGQLVAVTEQGRRGRVWITRQLAAGKLEAVTGIPEQKVGVTKIAFLDDGVLLGRTDGVVSSWNLDGKEPRWTTKTGGTTPQWTDYIFALRVSADGKTWAASNLNSVCIGSVTTGQQRFTLPLPKGASGSKITFSPDGHRLVVVARQLETSIVMWVDVASGKILEPNRNLPIAAMAITVSRDGTTVLVGGPDSRLHGFDMVTHAPSGAEIRHTGGVSALASSRDGRLVATCGFDQAARLWHWPSGKPIGGGLPVGSYASEALFTSNGQRLMVASVLPGTEVHGVSLFDLPAVLDDADLLHAARRTTGLLVGQDDKVRFLTTEEWASSANR